MPVLVQRYGFPKLLWWKRGRDLRNINFILLLPKNAQQPPSPQAFMSWLLLVHTLRRRHCISPPLREIFLITSFFKGCHFNWCVGCLRVVECSFQSWKFFCLVSVFHLWCCAIHSSTLREGQVSWSYIFAVRRIVDSRSLTESHRQLWITRKPHNKCRAKFAESDISKICLWCLLLPVF